MVRFLSEAAVVWMHEYLIRSYGGSHGIRDRNMLDSALHAAKLQWKYSDATIPELAAAYCYHLCQDHPFIDGNKRTARMAMVIFLQYNGFKITATEFDTLEKILKVATGQASKQELARWLSTVVAPK